MPPKRKNQKDIQDYMRPDIDPDDVDDNQDLDSVLDSVGDPEYNPETPKVHELEDDDDDAADDHASPKLPPSRIYTAREETRGRRNKRKQDIEDTIAGVERLNQSMMAKKSSSNKGPRSESRSPSASRRGPSTSKSRSPLQALLFLQEVVMNILLCHQHLKVQVEKKLV